MENKASARVEDRDWTRSVCKCGRVGNVMKMLPRNAGRVHRFIVPSDRFGGDT